MDSANVVAWLLLAAWCGVIAAGVIAALVTVYLALKMFQDKMYAWSVFTFISGGLWAAIIFYGAGVVARAFMAIGGG